MNEILQTPLSFAIIAATLVISFQFFKLNDYTQRQFLLIPYDVYRGRNLQSLISSMFIHGDWNHFIFNMLSFYFFGPTIERSIGSTLMITTYFVSGILGSLPLIIKNKHNPHYSALGASGAVSGIVFSFITLYPLAQMQLILLPIPMPAFVFGILYLAGSYYMSKRQGDNIAHEAHIAGALAGVVCMLVLV